MPPKKYQRKSRAPLRRKRVYKKKQSFASRVKKVMSSQIESKQQMLDYPITAFNSAATSSSDILEILPKINQGGDNGQRIGDSITAQTLNVRGHYMLSQVTGANNSRIAVRMMCVSPKRYSTYADSFANSTSWLSSVLQYGTTEQGLDGSIRSLYLPANTHTVTVHYDKVTYITQPFTVAPISGTTSVSNDLTNSTKFFNFNIRVKGKKLKYDNLTPSNAPNNFGPVLLFSYVKLDGSAADTVTTNALLSYLSTVTYEDA